MKYNLNYLVSVSHNYLKARANTLSFAGIYAAIFHSRERNLVHADMLFWCHDNHRIAVVDGKKYAPLIDTLIDHIGPGFSTITLAGPFSKYFGSACYGNVVMYNRTLLFNYIYRFIVYRTFSIRNVKSDPVIKAWSKILKKINPKAIIGITPSPELCIAAKQLGIWIADMQHGILAPGNFYDSRKRENIDQQGWPDVILCWDDFIKDFVDTHLSQYVIPEVIGNPAFFSKANKELILQADEYRPEENQLIPVLVTLTWHLPNAYKDDVHFKAFGMPASLVNFIKDHGSFCSWNLRLHPAQVTKRKNEVFQNLSNIFGDLSNVNWESSNKETLFDSLNKCSVHITFDSASSREAALRGIKTAILDFNEENALIYFGDLISENKARLISPDDQQNFRQWIIESNDDYIMARETLLHQISESKAKFHRFIDNFKAKFNQ